LAISLHSFNPNTKIESAKVNTNFSNLKTAVEDASYRGFPWGMSWSLVVGNEQGMKYIAPQNLTVRKLWAKTDSGTATIRIQKDTTDIHSGFDVTSSVGSTTSFNATVITAGQVLTLDITAADGTGLWVLLETMVTNNA